MDSGDKASNKAMAIAHKYALLQLLTIPTEDEKDPDAESYEVKAKSQPVGKSPEQGMKEQALALLDKLGLDEKVKQGMLIDHGGKVVENNGKKVWQGINWVDVLAELKARESASGGSEFADDVPWTVPAGAAQ